MPGMWLHLMMACTGADSPSTPADPAPTPALPDVILVLVDTLRADALGFAGAPHPSSPFLDEQVRTRWAAFAQAYACSSWTLPSTACLFTGRMPWEHRVVRSPQNFYEYGRLDPSLPTLASQLSARGYRTGAFLNNTFMAPEFGLDAGFDHYDYIGASNDEHRRADTTVQAALAWLDQAPGPALVVVHFMEPHYDYTPPEADRGRFTGGPSPTLGAAPLGPERVKAWMRGELPTPEERAYVRAAYQEEVLAVDRATQALVEGPQARGRWDNVRFVFTADHGEEFFEYGSFEHGHTTRSAVTHVPLLVYSAGVVPGVNNVVVNAPDVTNFLLNGSGVIPDVAQRGARPERVAVSQDTLYTPQELSITDGQRRLVVQMDGLQARLYTLDASGLEGELVSDDPQRRAEGEGLFNTLMRVRGGLEPTAPFNPSRVYDAETFEQLRALGYVGDE